MKTINFLSLALAAGPGPCFAARPESENLLQNGDFEQGLMFWTARIDGEDDATLAAAPQAGRAGSSCAAYRKDAGGGRGHFLFQDFSVEPNRVYVFGGWIRGDGTLQPSLLVRQNGRKVAGVAAPASREWAFVQGMFDSGDFTEFTLQWNAGDLEGEARSYAGQAYLDDAFVRPAACAPDPEAGKAAIRVHARKRLCPINPLLFGVNTLFHLDDDASLADGEIARLLREARCGLLRFPGGAVADNWDWKTQTLDRPEEWPRRWGPETTDTDEFMRFCRAVGAEPIFVCNFAKAISGPGLREAARGAAEWVEYCNQTKDYNVKYWEIGNETYLQHNKKTTTTAEAYAEGLAAFSRAMKAVDPTIQIGANGPSSPESPGKKGSVPWWPVICEKAIEHMDFLIIHEYYTVHNYSTYCLDGHEFGQGAQSLRGYLRQRYPARAEMPIVITEWNVNQGWRKGSGDLLGHAMIVANMLGDFARAGVDMAVFWPLRSLEGGRDRALLECETKDPTATYHAFKAFGTMCRGAVVESRCEGPVLAYAALGEHGQSLNVFVINPQAHPVECRLALDGFEPAPKAALHTLAGPSAQADAKGDPGPVAPRVSALDARREIDLDLPGPSLSVIELRGRLAGQSQPAAPPEDL